MTGELLLPEGPPAESKPTWPPLHATRNPKTTPAMLQHVVRCMIATSLGHQKHEGCRPLRWQSLSLGNFSAPRLDHAIELATVRARGFLESGWNSATPARAVQHASGARPPGHRPTMAHHQRSGETQRLRSGLRRVHRSARCGCVGRGCRRCGRCRRRCALAASNGCIDSLATGHRVYHDNGGRLDHGAGSDRRSLFLANH
jgi:hypothetical protein